MNTAAVSVVPLHAVHVSIWFIIERVQWRLLNMPSGIATTISRRAVRGDGASQRHETQIKGHLKRIEHRGNIVPIEIKGAIIRVPITPRDVNLSERQIQNCALPIVGPRR